MRKLTNVAIKYSPDGTLQDGGGLMLQKKGTGGKWIWRYSHLGKRRDMGLGSYPLVSLADARRLRDTWAAALAQGRDPISERRDEQEAAKRERDRADPTFAELVELVFEAKKASLCGDEPGECGSVNRATTWSRSWAGSAAPPSPSMTSTMP